MVGYNKVIIIGYLTRNPDFRALPSGTYVSEFGLATTRRFNSGGELKEQTCFIDVRFYGRQAEIINEYMKKGRPILVEGRLEYATWTGQDGVKRSKHRIIGESFQFLQALRPSEKQVEEERVGQVGQGEMNEPGPDADVTDFSGGYDQGFSSMDEGADQVPF